MTLRERQTLFLYNFSKMVIWGINSGIILTDGEHLRTRDQQMLYFEGLNLQRFGVEIKLIRGNRRSKTMFSRHLDKLAGDLNLIKDGKLSNNPADYQPLGEYWMSLHPDNVWGSDWNRNHSYLDETFQDPYHFEMKP
jgi:hypothetical protein